VSTISYKPSPTLKQFHLCDSFVKGVMGPIGSGKSVGCCFDILQSAKQAPVGDGGVRRTRALVARNTYRELEDTTIQTWKEWFSWDRGMGTFSGKDMKHTIDMPLEDGTRLYLEVLFRSLDKPEDVKKLLSLELTLAWLNEAREMPKAVLDMLQGRVGRYPSARVGGQQRGQIIMDTNPPDDDHWWYKTFEEMRPEGWSLFKQPSGVSPLAENIQNLPEGYYDRMMHGHTQEWINIYVHGKYGFVQEGKVIWPEYNDAVHAAQDVLVPQQELLTIGMDFGLTPAAAILEYNPSLQRMRVLDELVTDDMGASRFAETLNSKLSTEYPNHTFEFIGDPAGSQRAQVDESQTVYTILKAQGIQARPAPTNVWTTRREVPAHYMSRLCMDGKPAFLVSPQAKTIRKGLAGGYHYKRLKVAGDDRYEDKANKNKYSHPCEAMQYGILGAAGSHVLLDTVQTRRTGANDVPEIISDYNEFG